MLTRFTENISRYPKLFTAWLVGCVFAVAESYIPQLVGIDARHTQYANAVDFAIALVVAGLLYRWIVRDSRRTAILLDVAERFEGREVCCVSEHFAEDETEEFPEEPSPGENDEELNDVT